MTDETELRPCPFCGGEAEIINGAEYMRVGCKQLCAEMIGGSKESSIPEYAVTAWNTRAPEPVADTSKPCRFNTSNNGMRPIHPGEILLYDFVIPDLAMNLGLTDEQEDELYDIFDGVKPVSETMALIFSQVFDTTLELWMNLQRAYDEKVAERRQSEKTPNGNNRTETDGKTEDVTVREGMKTVGYIDRLRAQNEELAAALRSVVFYITSEFGEDAFEKYHPEAKAALEKYDGTKPPDTQ